MPGRDLSVAWGRRDFLRWAVAAGVGASRARGVGAFERDPGPLTHAFSPRIAVGWMALLYDRVRAERLSPPVAARVYAYAGVALYEAVVGGMPAHVSFSGRLNGMSGMPSVEGRPYHWEASGAAALATVAVGIAPWSSGETPAAFEQLLRDQQARLLRDGLPLGSLEESTTYGTAIGRAILAWGARDGFVATRSRPYTAPVGPDKWVPTPPTFAAALEPYWGTLRPFALAAPDACEPVPPHGYSEVLGSDFYLQAFRTYQAVRELRAEQLEVAQFWADNPGETGTPSGHWVSIENQLAAQLDLRLDEAAEMYARVGVALGDAFIACWHAKYRVHLLRPVTYIERHIDPRWRPLLMTPPFPEYTSGHSVASAAAVVVLTTLFGSVPFTDRTHDSRGLRPRSFGSFHDAASEAAVSRLYGGIHYPMAIEAGLSQGRCIGRRVSALRMRRGGA